MRIFLSVQQALRRHPIPAYGFWEGYFKAALSEAGHQIIEVPGLDWAEGLVPKSPDDQARWRAVTWTKTVDFIKTEQARRPIDLFLGYLFPAQIEPAAVRTIRDLGIPCVNFFCDNVREFTAVPAAFHAFDLHWVPEADARDLYRRARLPFLYAPMPMWVPPALRTPAATETEAVTFIGSHDALREELLGEAVALGLPVHIYGAGWRPEASDTSPIAARTFTRKLGNQMTFLRDHGLRGFAMRATYQFRKKRPSEWIGTQATATVEADAYVQLTRESQIVVGINRYPGFRHSFSRPHRYSRLRDIEAPMLGACYLTEAAPGLEDLYEPGTEIETYRNAAELVEKTALLQREPARRAGLRRRGQRRALAEHTVARSFTRIAERLGLSS